MTSPRDDGPVRTETGLGWPGADGVASGGLGWPAAQQEPEQEEQS
jgi:hypothetical protein